MSKIQVNEIVNHFDTGAPDCPKGLTVTGFTTFSGGVSIGGTLTYEDVTKINPNRPQIYARIDDDGVIRLSCTEEHPPFQEWLAEGNTPLPADTE